MAERDVATGLGLEMQEVMVIEANSVAFLVCLTGMLTCGITLYWVSHG